MLLLQIALTVVALFWMGILKEFSAVEKPALAFSSGASSEVNGSSVAMAMALIGFSLVTTILVTIGCGAVMHFSGSWLTSWPMTMIYIGGVIGAIAAVLLTHEQSSKIGQLILVAGLIVQMTTVYPMWMM